MSSGSSLGQVYGALRVGPYMWRGERDASITRVRRIFFRTCENGARRCPERGGSGGTVGGGCVGLAVPSRGQPPDPRPKDSCPRGFRSCEVHVRGCPERGGSGGTVDGGCVGLIDVEAPIF